MRIGIIGGSGLYEMDGVENLRRISMETPFGAPSDEFAAGEVGGVEVFFLSRHGRGHRLLPAEVNAKANICAFKLFGVRRLISVSAVGSLREEIGIGDIVMADQFVDRTKNSQAHTYFGDGIAAHIAFADPVCPEMRRVLAETAVRTMAGAAPGPQGRPPRVFSTGTYLNMEGPAFSTRAESNLYRSWGMDVIGMTNLREAKLAREAEICYSSMAMVTDYDCWHSGSETVNVEMLIQNLRKNVENAKQIILAAIPALAAEPSCSCGAALASAVVTAPEMFPRETRKRLAFLLDKYYPKA